MKDFIRDFRLPIQRSHSILHDTHVLMFYGINSVPVLISERLRHLPGKFFWIGGGHVDIKLRMGLQEFVDKYPCEVYFGDIVM